MPRTQSTQQRVESLIRADLEWSRQVFIYDTLPEQLGKLGFSPQVAGFLLARAALESKPWRPDYAGTLNPLSVKRRKVQPGERGR